MSTTLEVAPERTGWRDERISMRHRKWGWDCPALDIDFLLLELSFCKTDFEAEKHSTNAPWIRLENIYCN